ncbi:MAG: tetratricopeptide repeat protein [Oscillospiraceae bacterium]|nr:tetratricopeptide repeat protein [Oscillospiraceae bacterium]
MVILFFCIGKGTEGKAQTRECLTKDKIVELYQSSMEAVTYMSKNNWTREELYSERNQEFIYQGKTLLFCKMKWKSLMNLKEIFFTLYYYSYEQDTISNIIELTTEEINCYNAIFNQVIEEIKNSPSSFSEEKDENLHSKIYDIRGKYTIIFIETLKGTPSYTVRICNQPQLERIIANIENEHKEKQKKLDYVDDAFERYENLVESGNYDEALRTVDSLWDVIPEYNPKIITKREEIMALRKERKIKHKLNEGNNYYRNNQFEKAKECYEEVLNLTLQKHPEANRMLDSISRKMAIINSRDTIIYRYRDLRQAAFSSLTETISQNINNFIDNTEKGEFKLTLLVDFDTQQQNASSIDIIADDEAFDKKEPFYYTYIDRLLLLDLSTLSPPLMENIAINAADTLIVPLLWNSKQITVTRKFKKPPTIGAKKGFGEYREIIQSNFNTNQQYAASGRYTFVVKTKRVFNVNDRTVTANYMDISLKKFRTVGPEAMLYSMICPGAGNLAATQGKKGWGSFFTTLIFAGLGSAAILQTQKHYIPIDAKYDKYMKYGAYASFGIAGIIWTVDIFKALSRGCKNLKLSKQLRRELKMGEQSIVREPVVIE